MATKTKAENWISDTTRSLSAVLKEEIRIIGLAHSTEFIQILTIIKPLKKEWLDFCENWNKSKSCKSSGIVPRVQWFDEEVNKIIETKTKVAFLNELVKAWDYYGLDDYSELGRYASQRKHAPDTYALQMVKKIPISSGDISPYMRRKDSEKV